MSILVRKAGMQDSFQDLGRFGFRRFGIGTSGAMDRKSLRAANILLGNHENEAALEMHFPAPVLEFQHRIGFVLSGADFGAQLDGTPIGVLKPHTAKKGSVLSFSGQINGNRTYLSVKGGFVLNSWLSSTSTHLAAKQGGFEGRGLEVNDDIGFADPQEVEHTVPAGFRPAPGGCRSLRLVRGPAFSDLTAESELRIMRERYAIGADSNRMGYRLSGVPLHLLDDSQRLSTAVTFGTVQVLPDGQLVILMADHQTTGGYPNLGTIIGADLPIAAQLGRNDEVRFVPVSLEEAERALGKAETDFALLKTGLALRGFGPKMPGDAM